MSESKSHNATANLIAKKHHTEYNKGDGADIKTKNIAVEVETPKTISDASRQLQGHKKPVYIAGTNKEAVEKALDATKNTTISVMDSRGNIVRRSTRKRK
ncbi:MAG: hypothetical protein SCARUB_01874 [Candidatus Scalindua rubra]|uniref:Uncharacterized protein n=1 Tax=Candidatus Scalindua rubra TaxID=1872076 RepID=A0A1E3XBF9_9BACT|nr:MAG: hypothetical protein SCARUB_01874 [Candidatus Scalindua rubra]